MNNTNNNIRQQCRTRLLSHFFQHTIAAWNAIDRKKAATTAMDLNPEGSFRYCLYHVTTFDNFLKNYESSEGNLMNLKSKAFKSSWGDRCGGELGTGLYTSTLEGAFNYMNDQQRDNTVVVEIDVGTHLSKTGLEVPNRLTNCMNCYGNEEDSRCIAELDADALFLTNEKSVENLYVGQGVPQIKLTWRALRQSLPFRVLFFNSFKVVASPANGGGKIITPKKIPSRVKKIAATPSPPPPHPPPPSSSATTTLPPRATKKAAAQARSVSKL